MQFLSTHEYKKALKNIPNSQKTSYFGLILLENGEYQKACDFFKKQKNYYSEGFCHLLQGNLKKAREIWYQAPESPAISWGKTILGIINYKLEAIPSFLQIRNFLEMTLHYLLNSPQRELAYRLIEAKEFLADCNIETYKYIGRVLAYHDMEELAVEYLEKAISEIPQDYEAIFVLAELYLKNNDIKKAIKYLEQTLYVNKYHTPAMRILKELKSKSY